MPNINKGTRMAVAIRGSQCRRREEIKKLSMRKFTLCAVRVCWCNLFSLQHIRGCRSRRVLLGRMMRQRLECLQGRSAPIAPKSQTKKARPAWGRDDRSFADFIPRGPNRNGLTTNSDFCLSCVLRFTLGKLAKMRLFPHLLRSISPAPKMMSIRH
jgi:hypothetical protein